MLLKTNLYIYEIINKLLKCENCHFPKCSVSTLITHVYVVSLIHEIITSTDLYKWTGFKCFMPI